MATRNLVWWRSHESARQALICVAWAGAGAAQFRSWAEWLPPELSLCAVRLPGRETRLHEAPVDDMAQLVGELADDVTAEVEVPFAFFGQCSGALIVFEVARELRRRDAREPSHLFVASQVAPSTRDHSVDKRALDVRDRLRELGGTHDAILASERLLTLLSPALEADFRLSDDYVYVPREPLDIPIFVFAHQGSTEQEDEALQAWENETNGDFSLSLLQDDLFSPLGARSLANAVAGVLSVNGHPDSPRDQRGG